MNQKAALLGGMSLRVNLRVSKKAIASCRLY